MIRETQLILAKYDPNIGIFVDKGESFFVYDISKNPRFLLTKDKTDVLGLCNRLDKPRTTMFSLYFNHGYLYGNLCSEKDGIEQLQHHAFMFLKMQELAKIVRGVVTLKMEYNSNRDET